MPRKNKIEVVISAKDQISRSLQGITKRVFSLKSAVAGIAAGYGLKKLADGFIEVGSSMDKMRISLDTITKGEGNKWFKELNEWALKMPINTEKAIQSFTMMRAMGLRPTIEDMTVLVDTTSALGGDGGALAGIARALGQIKTKGKVSAEELMQLAERGIPAYEILAEKLHLTKKQLGSIGNAGIDAGVAVKALLEGMADRFGGQSKKIQNTWAGLMESLKSYWKEFQRLVMSFGVMQFLEKSLGRLISKIDELKKSGGLEVWAKRTAAAVLKSFKSMVLGLGTMIDTFMKMWRPFKRTISSLWKDFRSLPGWVQQVGVMGAILFGKLGVVALVAGIEVFSKISLEARGWMAIMKGELKVSDLLNKSYEEASKLLADLAKKKELTSRGQVVRGKIYYPGTAGAVAQNVAGEIDKIIQEMQAASDVSVNALKKAETAAIQTSQTVTTETEKATIERLAAYKTMYESLSDWGYSDYKTQLKLIAQQKKEFLKATKNKVLVEKWASAERQKAWEKDRLKFGKFSEGIAIAYEQMKRNATSFAQVAFDSFNSFVEKATSVFSDVFYDGLTGKLKKLKDYWDDFWDSMKRTFADSLASMLKDWVFSLGRMSGAKITLSGAGGGGGVSLTGMMSAVTSFFGGGGSAGGSSALSTLASAGSQAWGALSTGGGIFTAPSMVEAGVGFRSLASIPGMTVQRGVEGATLAFKGVPLGSYFTAGGLGALGYGTVGKWVGLPQSKYSGYTAGAGAAGGMYAGTAVGSALVASGTVGATVGTYVLPVVGTIIGAVLGGLAGSLFGGSKKKHKGTYAWKFGLEDRQLDLSRVHSYRGPGHVQYGAGWGGFQEKLDKVFENFDRRFEAFPKYIQEAMRPTVEQTEAQLSETIFSRYLNRQRRQAKALRKYFDKTYLPEIEKAYNKIIEVTIKMATELFDKSKEIISGTMISALNETDSVSAWEKFATNVKTVMYENIVSGIVNALAESAIYQEVLAPTMVAISTAFNQAYENGMFNVIKFQQLVAPAIQTFKTGLGALQPAFEAAYGVVSEIKGTLLPPPPPPPPPPPSEAPYYTTPEGERVFTSATDASARALGGVIVEQLQIMPNANIDEALFDKPLDWWIELAKNKVLPALNELGEAGALTTLTYEGA